MPYGKEAFDRIQAGEYAGTREINGVQRPSIFREYAGEGFVAVHDIRLEVNDRATKHPGGEEIACVNISAGANLSNGVGSIFVGRQPGFAGESRCHFVRERNFFLVGPTE